MALLGATVNTDTELKQLIASDFGCAQKEITVASGAGVLTRGTVLGMNTTTYEYSQHAPAASDGTETARVVLAEDIDATSAAVKCVAHVPPGKLVSENLIWATGITDAQKNLAILNMQDSGLSIDADFA